MILAAWASLKGDRLRVSLKVIPGAGRNEVTGPEVNAEGHALKVRVTASPEDGKANRAVIKLLAKRWGLAASLFSLVSEATARQKAIEIVATDKALLDKVLKIEETEGR